MKMKADGGDGVGQIGVLSNMDSRRRKNVRRDIGTGGVEGSRSRAHQIPSDT
jgi:hypothetical protein